MSKSERMTPEHLVKKGYVPDGRGGWCRPTATEAKQIGYTGPSIVERMATAQEDMRVAQDKITASVKKLPPLINVRTVQDFKPAHDEAVPYIDDIKEITDYYHDQGSARYQHLPSGEVVYIKHRFAIPPFPAPRMTRRDKYYLDPNHPDQKKRQRKVVTRYFAWKTAFLLIAKQQGYELTEVLRVIFIVPIPEGLSEKQKATRRGQKHQFKPDTDNYIKAIKDVFGVDDGFVWDERGVKIWGDKGEIIIF